MTPSKLILASGETFSGFSPSWQQGSFFGEVVFTTGMTGYVEALTDPSYAGQILVFTYPLIGNYGVPDPSFWESRKIQVSGVVVASASGFASHWNSKRDWMQWLAEERIPLISGVDTRELTKELRTQGTALGAICHGAAPQSFPDLNQADLVASVSCQMRTMVRSGGKRIFAVDCGMKNNILRRLASYPLEIVQVPFDFDYSEEEFDGLFLSNGPGDPAACRQTVAILRKALKRNKPTFGICLGAQLLALAVGGATYKLPFGHRGQNHPCIDTVQEKALLTSQNHGYAIDEKSLPEGWRVTFRNLNDQSVEGIAHRSLPFSAVQFHPESSPGPTDADFLFDAFFACIEKNL